jgi:hypothetical protein
MQKRHYANSTDSKGVDRIVVFAESIDSDSWLVVLLYYISYFCFYLSAIGTWNRNAKNTQGIMGYRKIENNQHMYM